MFKRIYVFTGMNPNGWLNQSKTMVMVESNKDDLFERAYTYYENVYVAHQSLMENDVKILTRDKFINTLEVGLDVKIVTVGNTIEFSLFEKNIWIDDEEDY